MTQYANPIYWWHFLLCDLSHVNKKHDMNKTSREIRNFSRGHLYCYLYEHSSSNTLSMWMPRSWNIQHQTLRMKLVDTSSVISTDYYIKYTTWMIKYATIMTLHKSSNVECLKINVKEKILITEFQTKYDGSWPDHHVNLVNETWQEVFQDPGQQGGSDHYWSQEIPNLQLLLPCQQPVSSTWGWASPSSPTPATWTSRKWSSTC